MNLNASHISPIVTFLDVVFSSFLCFFFLTFHSQKASAGAKMQTRTLPLPLALTQALS